MPIIQTKQRHSVSQSSGTTEEAELSGGPDKLCVSGGICCLCGPVSLVPCVFPSPHPLPSWIHLSSWPGAIFCFVFSHLSVDCVSKIGHTPLHLACRFGHLPVALLLLANRAELNARDKDDNIPLHKAASNGKALLCRELVKRGADIDARNNTGYTPLHWACFKVCNSRMCCFYESMWCNNCDTRKWLNTHFQTLGAS